MGQRDELGEPDGVRAIQDLLDSFRRRHIEPDWEHLDRPQAARFAALWDALAATGLTGAARPEGDGGLVLGDAALAAAMAGLGAALPALGAALVSHLTAQALLVDAGDGRWPAALAPDTALALTSSPLDATPATGFTLARVGKCWRLRGTQRVILPAASRPVVPAAAAGGLLLCTPESSAKGLSFAPATSSHGLGLLPFGTLTAEEVRVDDACVLDWPAPARATTLADGLVTALLAGMLDELALRATAYARQRKQAGKMISEHHAVQQLLGPMEISRRPLHLLASATLADSNAARRGGEGTSSAFAVPLVRRAGLDAIQTLGGYGYMEDYRVERYLRDANTLETFWIHAARRERHAVLARCERLARGEAA